MGICLCSYLVTPSVEPCARWAVPKASLTNKSALAASCSQNQSGQGYAKEGQKRAVGGGGGGSAQRECGKGFVSDTHNERTNVFVLYCAGRSDVETSSLEKKHDCQRPQVKVASRAG